MPILDAAKYQTLTNQTLTGGDLSAVVGWCAAVSSGITAALKPFSVEPLTLTNVVLDAPPERDLFLPVTPARSITSVYYRSDANGLAANFTSDYLLDNTTGEEYQLLIDDPVNGWARSGILRRIDGAWGATSVVKVGRLGGLVEPERGSVLVNYQAGLTSVPAEVEAAAVLAVSLLLARKRTGMPVVSESWNGYSSSYAGPFTAVGVLQTPDIASLLGQYGPVMRVA